MRGGKSRIIQLTLGCLGGLSWLQPAPGYSGALEWQFWESAWNSSWALLGLAASLPGRAVSAGLAGSSP